MIQPLDPSSIRPSRGGRDLVMLPADGAGMKRLRWKLVTLVGCGVLAAAALGWSGGAYLRAAPEPAPRQASLQRSDVAAIVAQGEATQAREMRRLADEMRALKSGVSGLKGSVERGQTAADIKALKGSVEALRQNVDAVKSSTSASIGQLSAKLDRADQATAQKLAQIAQRLDRLEKRPDPMPVGSIRPRPPLRQSLDAAPHKTRLAEAAPPAPGAGASPARSPAPKVARPKMPLPGWVLRDVYDGIAVVEGRGGYHQVTVGQVLPGAGRVEAIEQRDGNWVVVTSLGLIAADWN